jgi:predicted Zn-dependent protease
VPPPGAPDNYLFYVTPKGLCRWTPGTMPLKVYVNSGKNCKGFQPEFQSVLINSFLTWQNATRGMIRFVPVDDFRVANVECKWTDSAANLTLAAEAGDAKIESFRNNIYRATITILTCRPEAPEETLSLALLQQVCLHEIGHALGLNGHSDRAQDIMYCSTNPNVEHPQLTQRDINTLYLLYQ